MDHLSKFMPSVEKTDGEYLYHIIFGRWCKKKIEKPQARLVLALLPALRQYLPFARVRIHSGACFFIR